MYKHQIISSYRLKKIFIVSVGNLTVGGAGKTPFVVLLSKLLSKYKQKHFIVSRGYKKKSSGQVVVSDGKNILSTPVLSGDEPYLLSKLLKSVPVVVGNKLKAIVLANQSFGISTCIIDDGFQTFKIQKNINVLLLDASLPLNKYKLLPLGVLREPLTEIKRADVVVLTKTNFISHDLFCLFKQTVSKYIDCSQQLLLESEYSSRLLVLKNKRLVPCLNDDVVGESIISISGVARNNSFNALVKQYFTKINKTYSFSDHFKYSSSVCKKIKLYMQLNNINTLVTTHKDFVKLGNYFSKYTVYVIEVDHQLACENLLEDFIINKLKIFDKHLKLDF